jgi:hypothetical protein
MRIQVVKCQGGFEVHVIASVEGSATRPDRKQWENLCLDRGAAAN